jgi:hypothetical protein
VLRQFISTWAQHPGGFATPAARGDRRERGRHGHHATRGVSFGVGEKGGLSDFSRRLEVTHSRFLDDVWVREERTMGPRSFGF